MSMYYLVPGVSAALYYWYYRNYCRKKPEIFAGPGPFFDLLKSKCPVLQEEYAPIPFLHDARIMTVISALSRHRDLNHPYLREVCGCSDGGEIILDWLNSDPTTKSTQKIVSSLDNPSEANISQKPSPVTADTELNNLAEARRDDFEPILETASPLEESRDEAKPPNGIILILPGLTGDSSRNYIQGIVQTTQQCGYAAVVMNYRGCVGSLKTPRSYCAADTTDVAQVVRHIRTKYPGVPMMAIGISLGGVLVTNYVADCGKNDVESGLIAAMAVSAPWNISLSCEVLERPVNWYLFNRILARELCKTVNRHAEVLQPVFDSKQLEGVRTIRQFDDVYTAKMFGYSGVEDYYKSATLHTKVDLIKTPLLALNAADDMFSPYEGIPTEAASKNPNLCIVITSHGGHIGFLEGWNAFGKNYVERLFAQFATAVFGNYEQREDDKSKVPSEVAESTTN